MKSFVSKWLQVFLLSFALSATAAVEYLEKENVLWASDYPETFPCSPRRLLEIDRQMGWGKVTNDETGRVYTLCCGLRIGKNDGSDTYFQIGAATAADETLIVRGDVRVWPLWLPEQNGPITYNQLKKLKSVNRLTIGALDSPTATAALRIDNSLKKGFSLIVGGESGTPGKNYGGQLFVFNGSLGPVGDVPIGAGPVPRPVWVGGNNGLVFKNTRIFGLAVGFAAMSSGTFADCVFANCGVALNGTYQREVARCVFRNCGVAVEGAVHWDLTLENCAFENNKINWVTRGRRILAIDCAIDSLDKGRYSGGNGYFISKRHVSVRVTDESGAPVAGAIVRGVPDRKPPDNEYDLCQAKTDHQGTASLLLSEILIDADARQKTPSRRMFVYSLEAEKGGRVGRAENFHPGGGPAEIAISRPTNAKGDEGNLMSLEKRSAR